MRGAVMERAAVMRAHDKKTHGLSIESGERVADCAKVAERFRHFFIADVHMAVMHPVMNKGLPGCAFALCNFIFMMRKLQIQTAAVNIKAFAEQRGAHRRAFNMPARPPAPPAGFPNRLRRLARLRALPQCKIERIAFRL